MAYLHGNSATTPGQESQEQACQDDIDSKFNEPTAAVKERAMGYQAADIAAQLASEQERRAILGQCMDANSLIALFTVARC